MGPAGSAAAAADTPARGMIPRVGLRRALAWVAAVVGAAAVGGGLGTAVASRSAAAGQWVAPPPAAAPLTSPPTGGVAQPLPLPDCEGGALLGAARRLGAQDGGAPEEQPLPHLTLYGAYNVWSKDYVTEAGQSVCVVTRAHGGPEAEARLLAHLMSLFVPNHPKLTVVLVDAGGGEHAERLAAIAGRFNRLLGRAGAVAVSRWTAASARARFPRLAGDDRGYLALDLALEDALGGAPPAQGGAPLDCTFVHLSDSDNLYSLHFLPLLMKRLNEGADMVGIHWVSRHEWRDASLDRRTAGQIRERGECGPLRSGKNVEMWAADDFRVGCIDLGAVVARAALLRSAGARLALDRLPSPDADGAGIDFGVADGQLYARLHAAAGAGKTAIIRRALMFQQALDD